MVKKTKEVAQRRHDTTQGFPNIIKGWGNSPSDARLEIFCVLTETRKVIGFKSLE